MHNKTIIEFGFRMLAIIIKASVCVIRFSLRLQQITQTLALIIVITHCNDHLTLLKNTKEKHAAKEKRRMDGHKWTRLKRIAFR